MNHDDEHYLCEQLGEGAQVPVTCSCGETWVGHHDFHDQPRNGYAECDPIRTAYMDGFQLAARIENQHAVAAIAIAALAILGKDRSDGPVDLGALGTWTAE